MYRIHTALVHYAHDQITYEWLHFVFQPTVFQVVSYSARRTLFSSMLCVNLGIVQLLFCFNLISSAFRCAWQQQDERILVYALNWIYAWLPQIRICFALCILIQNIKQSDNAARSVYLSPNSFLPDLKHIVSSWKHESDLFSVAFSLIRNV